MLKPRSKNNTPRVTVRNFSEPSISSRGSGNSGPSQKEPASITSTWRVGWQTPTLMLSCYIIALAVAVAHLLMFRYLNGKEADGPDEIAPQSYISTASNILANAFGFALRGALAVAFVQYLWHLLRVSTLKVSTIEILFCLRSNPFLLFKPTALSTTPLLSALAILMWVSQIATSFPPGALTITTTQQLSYGTIVVPTFNASFMGNGSGADANTYSLITLAPAPPFGFINGGFDEGKDTNLINRLARQVLIAGDSFAMPSPCGVNCSYVMEFEGPYFECNDTSTDTTFYDAAEYFTIYSGQWSSPPSAALIQSLYNGTYTLAYFNSTTLIPVAVDNAVSGNQSTNSSVSIQEDNVICLPGRANFTVNNTWENNVLSRTVSSTPIDRLINLDLQTHQGVVVVPGFCAPIGNSYGTTPANWSTAALAFYRDNNMMTIFNAMVSWLDGEFQAFLATETNNTIIGPDSNGPFQLAWDEKVTTLDNGVAISEGAQNGTVIDSTRFNAAFGQYSAFEPGHPAFNITQDTLNDYLFNMTVSMMMAYGTWNTTANVTRSTAINVYSFSRPLNLILPYFVSLLVSLPFIIIGGVALLKNGVSAMDGSFMQIVTTSTGSAILDKAAAGGCLGGNESAPEELKNLRIRFGEIIHREEPGKVKRAGFGVESEVTSLKKGGRYGIARWI